MATARPRVAIIGGGFGGLNAALQLRRAPVDVALIDRRNHHTFQPLLYQVATGGLSPANIASPLRALVKRLPHVQVLNAEVLRIDLAARTLHLDCGTREFDQLIVATGATNNYFGHPEWEQFAPGLKSIEEATHIRARILSAFERAELTQDPEERSALLTFAIIGAGPTGVEMAGAIRELAAHTLLREFRSIQPQSARVILVEGMDRVLTAYAPDLSKKALQQLEALGVEVRTQSLVTAIAADAIEVKCGESTERIATHTVIWAAGVQASPLAKQLADQCEAKLDRSGRIVVEPDLSLAGAPYVFAIGDMASCTPPGEARPIPGVAPAAIQQGTYVAKLIAGRLRGETVAPFYYVDKGSMATIGRAAAVAQAGPFKFSGYLAWLAWLFIHLIFLVRFENRLLVLVQWAWNYLTRNRSARLITEGAYATWPGQNVRPRSLGDPLLGQLSK